MINEKNDFEYVFNLGSAEDSMLFGSRLAKRVFPSMLLTFSGEIGTGKTTIIRSLLKSLGITSAIKSPTFSLVESYDCGNLTIHHFDLYRIHSEEELDYIGFRDFFSEQSICLIEWPEHAGKGLPTPDIRFNLESKGMGRQVHVVAFSSKGKSVLEGLIGESCA